VKAQPAKPIEGVLVTDEELQARARLEQLAWLMDESFYIPGLNMRIGVDGLLGLIPGIGDLISAAISSYVIAEASRLGAPRTVLLRMSGNVLIDTVVGAIPFLGDLFDFGFKANRRNVQLLTRFLDEPRKTQRSSWLLLAGIFAVLAAAVVGAVYMLGSLLSWMFSSKI
jgi:hypothetical protein